MIISLLLKLKTVQGSALNFSISDFAASTFSHYPLPYVFPLVYFSTTDYMTWPSLDFFLPISCLIQSSLSYRRLEGPACCPCPRGQKTTGWRHSIFKRRAAVRSTNQTSQCNGETRTSVCASRIGMHSAIGRLLI